MLSVTIGVLRPLLGVSPEFRLDEGVRNRLSGFYKMKTQHLLSALRLETTQDRHPQQNSSCQQVFCGFLNAYPDGEGGVWLLSLIHI